MFQLETLSNLDLFFYGPMAHAVLAEHGSIIAPLMTRHAGAQWVAKVEAAVRDYRVAVEALIKDLAETTGAIDSVNKTLGDLTAWRRMMESFGRMAPVADRDLYLQAGGYGLGTARTPKQAKDFLLAVKVRVELLRSGLSQFGAPDAALDFPQRALAELEKVTGVVAKEKAEDSVARHAVRRARAALLDLVERATLIADAVHAEKQLFGTQVELDQAKRVVVGLQSALDEARVLSRQKAPEVPVEIHTSIPVVEHVGVSSVVD